MLLFYISPHEKFYCDASDGFFLFDTYCQLKKFGTVMGLMGVMYLIYFINLTHIAS